MDTPNIIAVVASFVSVAVGVLAIWLATMFYRMSSQFSESAREADRRITTSVERLEKLFDSLYSDTFSMMRDTVSDMRKHIWPAEQTDTYDIEAEIEKKSESKMKELMGRTDLELSELLQRQTQTDSRLESLSGAIQQLISKAVKESRAVDEEARRETLRESIRRLILSVLDKTRGGISASDLWGRIGSEYGLRIPFPYFYAELVKMRDEGMLLYDEPIGLQPESMVIRKS